MSTALQPLIQSRILALRDQRVLLDADLAQLYEAETRVLVQAVKRNARRFPEDFMCQLTAAEFADLKSQSVISSGGHGGRRTAPQEDFGRARMSGHEALVQTSCA